MIFRDRKHAGQMLAAKLAEYEGDPSAIVLALPRGGVPIVLEIARKLAAPLDVFIVRKVGVPGREELAMGAVACGGTTVINQDVLDLLGIAPQTFAESARIEQEELVRREHEYRGDRPVLAVENKTIILVDDGIATGATMQAAAAALAKCKPRRLIVPAPVAASGMALQFTELADKFVVLDAPDDFRAVGLYYESFPQLTDETVRQLLSGH